MKCRASRLRRSLVVAALACALLAARQSGGGETVAAPQLQPSGGETAAVPNPQTRFPPLTAALRKSFAHHLLVNERFRLVLCAIPKVASTELIKLVHRLGDDARWRRDPHFRRDAPLFSRLKARDARRCLDDGNWTWAVFFRDPAARLLSAYRDKFRAGVVANKRYALREFGRESMTFADFVDAVADGSNATRGSPTGLHPWTNPHWRPQRFLCPRPASRDVRRVSKATLLGNNDLLLHRYDFVGSFERLAADASALLRRLGAWDAYGRKGWGEHRSRTPIFADAAAHAAKAKDAFTEAYADGALLARVRDAYAADYAMLDAVGFSDATGPTRGAELDPLLCDLDPPRCAGD